MEHVLRLRAFDRRLFLTAAVLFTAIVFVGFGQTYYVRAWFSTTPLSSVLLHVHGATMTLWVLLFVAQVALISTRRVALHRSLGWAGVGVAAAIVLTGVPTALHAGKYGFANAPPGLSPLAFMIVPFFDLVMFVLFFSTAILLRRRAVPHKSMMLLTVLNFLPPALARIPIAGLRSLGPLLFFGLPTVFGLLAVFVDARYRGHVNRWLAGGLALLVASYVVRLAVMTSDPWIRFATWATTFV